MKKEYRHLECDEGVDSTWKRNWMSEKSAKCKKCGKEIKKKSLKLIWTREIK